MTIAEIEAEVDLEANRRNPEIVEMVLDAIIRNIVDQDSRQAALEQAKSCEHQFWKVRYLRLKRSIERIKKDLRLGDYRFDDSSLWACLGNSVYVPRVEKLHDALKAKLPLAGALKGKYRLFVPCGTCEWCKCSPHGLWNAI